MDLFQNIRFLLIALRARHNVRNIARHISLQKKKKSPGYFRQIDCIHGSTGHFSKESNFFSLVRVLDTEDLVSVQTQRKVDFHSREK